MTFPHFSPEIPNPLPHSDAGCKLEPFMQITSVMLRRNVWLHINCNYSCMILLPEQLQSNNITGINAQQLFNMCFEFKYFKCVCRYFK